MLSFIGFVFSFCRLFFFVSYVADLFDQRSCAGAKPFSLSDHLSADLSDYLSVCLSDYLSVCLSDYLSDYLGEVLVGVRTAR